MQLGPETTLSFCCFQDLWKLAETYPLYGSLLDLNYYIFQCINQSAEQEELLDGNRKLCDVKPFWPMLRVIRKASDVEEKVLNSKIGLLIGKSKFSWKRMTLMDDIVCLFVCWGVSLLVCLFR